MNPNDQIGALEKAIFERAKMLADEHLRQAQRARERILADSADRLRLLEGKEMLLATEPELFFTEQHYTGFPAVLVRLAAVETGVQGWTPRAFRRSRIA